MKQPFSLKFKNLTRAPFWLTGGLPVILFLLTFIITGCFYETNDDILITFLLQGVAGAKPLSDLSLYFHGISFIISKLYQIVPSWPWYGITLYTFLFIATVLAFRFIYYSLAGKLKTSLIFLVIFVFYVGNWYEHVFWMNYSRVPILLAAVVLLNAWIDILRLPPITWWRMLGYGSLFFLALCIRPGLALYGSFLALPIALFPIYSSQFKVRKLTFFILSFVLAGLFFSGWLIFKTSPLQSEYRHLDWLKSQMLDYNWCCGPLPGSKDNLIYTAINYWFLADAKVIQFLKQQYQHDWYYFWHEAAFNKTIQLIKYLIYDQFLVLIFVISHLLWLARTRRNDIFRAVLVYHFLFWAVIFFVGIFLKIPPRVLTPSMSILLLIHLALPNAADIPEKLSRGVTGIMFILLLLQLYKMGSRVNWQQQRQKQSEMVINVIQNQYPGQLILAAGLSDELRALSPFRNYNIGKRPLLFLTGWQTLDPSYATYLQKLSGQRTLNEALKTLTEHKNTVWVSSPEFIQFLEMYYKMFYHQILYFNVIKPVSSPPSPVNLYFYKLNKVVAAPEIK